MPKESLSHYIKYGARIQEYHLNSTQFRQLIIQGGNQDMAYRALRGEIVLDNNHFFEQVQRQLLDFSDSWKEQKLQAEFLLFLRRYLLSKRQIQEERVLDAYSNILQALQHWARLVIIEEGFLPEGTVWEQVRDINLGVYKLYEELTYSRETVAQRVELVLLACEFSVMSKMKRCCALLLRVLSSRSKAWSVSELLNRPELSGLDSGISLLLKCLVKKWLVKEVAIPLDDELSRLELRYSAQLG